MKKTIILLFCLLSVSLIAKKFNTETHVTLKDGTEVRIDSLLQGDSILAIHPLKNEITSICVTRINKSTENSAIRVYFVDGTSLTLSPDAKLLGHSAWLTKEKTVQGNTNKKTKKLKSSQYNIDDFVVCINQYMQLQSIPIIDIEVLNSPLDMYSLEFDSPILEDIAFLANGVFVSQ